MSPPAWHEAAGELGIGEAAIISLLVVSAAGCAVLWARALCCRRKEEARGSSLARKDANAYDEEDGATADSAGWGGGSGGGWGTHGHAEDGLAAAHEGPPVPARAQLGTPGRMGGGHHGSRAAGAGGEGGVELAHRAHGAHGSSELPPVRTSVAGLAPRPGVAPPPHRSPERALPSCGNGGGTATADDFHPRRAASSAFDGQGRTLRVDDDGELGAGGSSDDGGASPPRSHGANGCGARRASAGLCAGHGAAAAAAAEGGATRIPRVGANWRARARSPRSDDGSDDDGDDDDGATPRSRTGARRADSAGSDERRSPRRHTSSEGDGSDDDARTPPSARAGALRGLPAGRRWGGTGARGAAGTQRHQLLPRGAAADDEAGSKRLTASRIAAGARAATAGARAATAGARAAIRPSVPRKQQYGQVATGDLSHNSHSDADSDDDLDHDGRRCR